MYGFTHSRALLLAAILAGGAFTTAGCKDDQVLYTDKEEPKSVEVAQADSGAPTEETPAALPAGHPDISTMPTPAAEVPIPGLPAGHPPLEATMSGQAVKLTPPPADRPVLDASVTTVEVTLPGLVLTVPTSWTQTPAAELSPMRAAQFAVPAPEGAARGAELVAFHFGKGQGGGAAANVQRWIGQMELAEGAQPGIYAQSRDGLTLTEVTCEGTLKPSGMGSGPTEPQAGSMLHGVIIEGGPEGAVFLKMTGSAEAVKAADPAIATMLAKVHPVESTPATEKAAE
ncbi:hypothetical protein HZA57_06545 [Candidatus Poribacteria bacterium]|nr:hypothetical protein [Candidatus Poribacteria bacterium]